MAKSGVKGNSGGKKGRSGRKSKAQELGLKTLLDECWTVRDRKACIRKLATDAKSPDFKERHEARTLLLAYAFGRPKVPVEINPREALAKLLGVSASELPDVKP